MHMNVSPSGSMWGGMTMFSGLSFLFILAYLAFIGLGLYTLYLIIKALKIYIRNNEDRQDRDQF